MQSKENHNQPIKEKIQICPKNTPKKITICTRRTNSKDVVDVVCDDSRSLKTQLTVNGFQTSQPSDELVVINYDHADLSDQWSWGIKRNWHLSEMYKSKIENLYKDYHNKKTWGQVLTELAHGSQKRHKSYEIGIIIAEARRRLKKIKMDEYDEIFRFRIDHDFRFYGFINGNTFLALWHDPIHKIYSGKRNKSMGGI